MHTEKVMTDIEREQLAQIAGRKAAKSRGQSAVTITLLTKKLASTREALEDANAAQIQLSKELDRVREQIAELECVMELATEWAARRPV